MDPVLFVLSEFGILGLLFGGTTLLQLRRNARRTGEASRLVAETAELEGIELARKGPAGSQLSLRGRSGPVTVEIGTRLLSGPRGQWSVITITGLAPLSLGAEGFRSDMARRLGGTEIEVGDRAFDETLFVRGKEGLVRSVLDAETRRLTLLLFEGRVEVLDQDTTRALESAVSVQSGELRVEAVNIISSPKWTGECLLGLLNVARRLARPADIPGRLAVNACDDPLAPVRLANLRVLVAEYPDRPATRHALRSRLEDADPTVRLWAAVELGEEGRAVLAELASSCGVAEETQANAIGSLGAELARDVGVEVLSRSLRARRLTVAEACLAALGQRGGADVVDPLAKVLAVERGALALAAVRALGASGEPSGETPLAAALERRDEGVAVAAAEALGEVGTAAVIPSLRAMESGSDDDDLRGAAREAVARIQERLTGASPGQLSLAGGESGQLSLTEDERGRVALHDDESRGDGGGRQ